MSAATNASADEGMIRAAPTRTGPNDAERTRVVPPEVERRYGRDVNRLLFPDGTPAIEDRGASLIARTGNLKVAQDLVEIAKARGWDRISSRGSDAFRAEIARTAVRRGIEVTNDPKTARATATDQPEPKPAAPEPLETSSRPRRSARRVGDLMTGEFLEAGKAPYRFKPENPSSFYVRIATERGPREVWGAQLREALSDSWTFPQPGDRIGVQFLGTQKLERGDDRSAADPRTRNLWRIEKASFFEERKRDAASIRRGGPDLSAPEAMTPNAREVAAILRAANLFAAQRLARSDDRERFIESVRGTLATTLEAGGRLPSIRLRDRQQQAEPTRMLDPRRADVPRPR